MSNATMNQAVCNEESSEIFANVILTFEENLIANDSDGCSRYGCTCIAYEIIFKKS